MTVVQNWIPESLYSLKCPYSMTPTSITVHNTANDASAEDEAAYMMRNGSPTSFHVVIDDEQVILLIPFNRNAFHAGDGEFGNGNRTSISIEICYSKSGGPKFDQAEKNAAKYIASLLKEYKWDLPRVKKHQDWSGKYCPHRTLDYGWDRFLNMVRSEINNKPKPGWKQYGRTYKYVYQSGEYASPGWHTIDGKQYYFHNNGMIAINESIQRGNKVFIFDKTGAYIRTEKATGKVTWNRNAEVEAGDIVAAFNLNIRDADDRRCYVPALGIVSMKDVYENSTKSKDGNPTDNHLANTASVVNTTEWEVTKVDVKNNLLQCNGQWWPAGPFSRKEYK